MIDLTDCIVLGTITKTHGIHGQVVLLMDQLSFNDIQKLESVFIEIDGLPVPFFISGFEEKNSKTLILTFDDIGIVEIIKDLVDCQVYIPRSVIRSEKQLLGIDKNIVGYHVTDKSLGSLGVVAEMISIEHNPLIKIIQGKKEILLPLQPDFILQIDAVSKNIYVNVPEGLIDLS
jgi:16S rRNA processing protein RimM